MYQPQIRGPNPHLARFRLILEERKASRPCDSMSINLATEYLKNLLEPIISMPDDHPVPHVYLVTVIQFNTFYGILQNKQMLETMLSWIGARKSEGEPPRTISKADEVPFPGQSTLAPKKSGPFDPSNHLAPSLLQLTVEHQTWIDALPFPNLRDNLIMCSDIFDHYEFVGDGIGDLIDRTSLPRHKTLASDPFCAGLNGSIVGPRDTGAPAQAGGGLILWGDPSKRESWELSADFVAR